MLPYSDRDLDEWPIEVRRALPSAYSAISERVPVSGRNDQLEVIYPFYGPRRPALRLSSVGADIYQRTLSRRRSLQARQVTGGQARLAVRSGLSAPEASCVYCGRCLTGCVYHHIWSANILLDQLLEEKKVSRVRGYAMSLTEGRGEAVVRIACGNRLTELAGKRIFVACGPLATANLLQRSGLIEQTIYVRDSQTVFIPFAFGGASSAPSEPEYTLSQIFVRLEGSDRHPRPSQVQLYTYNPSLVDRARAARPFLALVPRALLAAALRRMVIGIGFLHSDMSGQIAVTSPERGARLCLRAEGTSRAQEAARSWMRELVMALAPLRLMPLSPLADVTSPGGGFHIGASMPMSSRRSGTAIQTDLLGRLPGMVRTHIVDSSVFPSLPAGPITYTAMANAWRIVHESASLE
jgi:hypothetical protein